MSDSLAIGIIAEGPTDHIVIKEAIQNLTKGKGDITFYPIQPELTESFAQIEGQTGTGWSGVYRQIEFIREYGDFQVATNLILSSLDVLVVHLDGDVSRETYERGHLSGVSPTPKVPLCEPIPCPLGQQQQSKPCVKACSVPRQKVAQLQGVLLGWMGLTKTTKPKEIVLCTPFDATDAWVLAALFPTHRLVQKKKMECHQNPVNILEHVCHIDKSVKDYQNKVENQLRNVWNIAQKNCPEAERFSEEFLESIAFIKKRRTI